MPSEKLFARSRRRSEGGDPLRRQPANPAIRPLRLRDASASVLIMNSKTTTDSEDLSK